MNHLRCSVLQKLSTLAFVGLVFLGLGLAGSVGATDFALEPTIGIGGFTDDARDIAGAGAVLGGRLILIPKGSVRIVFTGLLGLHPPGRLDEVVDAAAGLALIAGPRLAIGGGANSKASVEIGVGLGRSGLGWEYTPAAEAVFFTDTDGIGAWVIQPEGTLLVNLSEELDLTFNGSYELMSWDDETSEGFSTTGFGGNAFKMTVGLRIGL